MNNFFKNSGNKIWDGFLHHIGSAIAIFIGAFIGSYFAGQKVSENVVEELVRRDSTFIVNQRSNFEMAEEFENKGFQALVEKDFENASSFFTASENSANGYHCSYEIANYLRKNKDSVSDPDFWKRTYQFVIEIARSYIPSDNLIAMEQSIQKN